MIVEARHAIAQSVAPGVEVLAIGDIHGEAGLLDALLDRAAKLPVDGRRLLVFTGDLIDRGPASLAALRLAREGGVRVGAAETVALMGNHEQMALCALAGAPHRRRAAFALWVANGGDATLHEAFGDKGLPADTLERLVDALGESLDFLMSMRSSWRSGDVLFVHAGVSPTRPHDEFLSKPWDIDFETLREAEHWAWIREPFLRAPAHGGLFVVHGHEDCTRFERALELVVKTTQFNTTGRRWTRAELAAALPIGVSAITFAARDRLCTYGLVGIIIIRDDIIDQVAMSCRVIGLGVEDIAIRYARDVEERAGHAKAKGRYVPKGSDHPSPGLRDRTGLSMAVVTDPTRPRNASELKKETYIAASMVSPHGLELWTR